METSEQDLVRQAIDGDRLALDRLLAMHACRIVNHLRPRMPSSLRGVIDAEDVVQQTFLQAYRDIESFQPFSQGSFYAWLRGIADNRLLDCVREMKRKKRGGDFHRLQKACNAASSVDDVIETLVAGQRSPSRSVAMNEAKEALQICLATLPDDQREAIDRHCLQGQSLQEAAEAMNRTPGAIRALVHRGKAKLREEIASSAIFSRRH